MKASEIKILIRNRNTNFSEHITLEQLLLTDEQSHYVVPTLLECQCKKEWQVNPNLDWEIVMSEDVKL